MKRKFVKIYESLITRYDHGGFLADDVVVFKDGALKDPFFDTVDDDYKAEIERLIKSGSNIRVVNIKSTSPVSMGAGNTDNNGYSFSVEVAEESAPGRIGTTITIPQHLIKKANPTLGSLPNIPDKFKRPDTTQIKPVEVKDEAEEVPFYGPGRTRTADIGNKKDTKSVTSLANKNVTIPSSPSVDAKDPASYTAKYLP